MTGSTGISAPVRWVAVGAAALVLQGCGGVFPQLGAKDRTDTSGSDQIIVPEPEPSVTPTPTRARATTPATSTRTPVLETAPKADLNVSATYFVRLLVPVGSELSISAKGAGPASETTIKTQAGPPYAVSVPVPDADGAYPMTVTATLSSTIGHVLEGQVTLDKAPSGAVEIVMVPKS